MSDSGQDSGDVFAVERVRDLVSLMKEHDLSEIDLRCGDQRIRLCRGGEPTIAALPAPAPVHVAPAVAPPVAAAPAAPAPAPAAGGGAAEDSANIEIIKSPMVGTFYSRPNPKAEAFVKVGDRVSPESPICIIEAMKVFNEIPAEISGTIVAILVDDEEPVEFDKPLFKVDTSK